MEMGQQPPRVDDIFRIRRISDSRNFASLQTSWRELEKLAGNNNPFLTFEWLDAWWRHFGEHKQLCVLIAEEEGAVVGIAPLMLVREFGFTKLQFLGRPFSDYSDFLAVPNREDIVLRILGYCDQILRWDQVELEGVPEISPNLASFRSHWAERRGITRLNVTLVAPFVPLSTSWDDFRASLRPKVLKDTSRRMRRLQDRGPVTFELCEDLDSALAMLDHLAVQKSARYETTGARGIFREFGMLEFLKDATRGLWNRGAVHITSLVQGGNPLAIHFGFQCGETFMHYMPSFDDRYAKYSVGRLLNFQLLEMCFRNGIKEFDFLPGDEAYKHQWSRRSRSMFRFAAYAPSVKGFALFGAKELGLPWLRKLAGVRAAARRCRSTLLKIKESSFIRLRRKDRANGLKT